MAMQTRYELRSLRLYVGRARMPVSQQAVLCAVRLWQERTGQLVTWTGGVATIDAELGRAILAAERDLSVHQLAGALRAA
jgi:hypothetical protein